jgi:tetratricopeptide (TPR) repeat protein
MKRIIGLIKITLSIAFLAYSIVLIHPLFLAPAAERLDAAENYYWQGVYYPEKIFDVLIFQNPNHSEAYFGKSVPYNKRGDFAKGFEILNKAVEIDPKIHLGYRGWLKYDFLKDYQGCIKDLKRLDSLTPNFVDYPWGDNIHYLLGLSYKGLKQYDESLKEFDKGLKSEKDSSWANPNLFLYKGIIYAELKDYKQAMSNFDACLKNNHNKSSEAYYHKGIIFKNLKQVDSAKTSFKMSLELFNNGYKNTDEYTEVADELYLSDILEEINSFDK